MAQAKTKELAEYIQSFGRHGDSELVHLNPVEVDLLRSMSPMGELTTNPDTGLKEAFLPFLLGLLPSLMGTGGMLAGVPGAALLASHPTLAGAGLSALGGAIEGHKGNELLMDAGMGGLSGGIGKMFGGAAKAAPTTAEKTAANLAAISPSNHIAALASNHIADTVAPAASGGMMAAIKAHPFLTAGAVGLAGMGLRGKNPKPIDSSGSTDSSFVPTPGPDMTTVPLANEYTYGMPGTGGEQDFFPYM